LEGLGTHTRALNGPLLASREIEHLAQPQTSEHGDTDGYPASVNPSQFLTAKSSH
jgi:hypothetical protein